MSYGVENMTLNLQQMQKLTSCYILILTLSLSDYANMKAHCQSQTGNSGVVHCNLPRLYNHARSEFNSYIPIKKNNSKWISEVRKHLPIQNNKRNVIQHLQSEPVRGIYLTKTNILPSAQHLPREQQSNKAIDIQYRKEDWEGTTRPNFITNCDERNRDYNGRFYYLELTFNSHNL